jgi:hypothetical protein
VSVFAALAPLKLVGRVLAVPFALIFLVDAATGLVSVVLGVGLTAWWIARWEKPAERPEFNSWSVGATIVRGFSVLFDLSCFYVLGRSSRWWGIG